jgi:hypothetical protein
MKRLAPWAWLVVLGTALALSWWSLDVLALHFGMPKVLAAMVSATFDGAALVAADLAIRRAAVAEPAFAVKLLMVTTVALSAWLNYEHGMLLGYPVVARMLFAAPPVISGWLFELQLRSLYRARRQQLGRTIRPVPQFGWIVWCFHPWATLKRLSQIGASRLQSVPVTVMDWDADSVQLPPYPVILAAPVEMGDDDDRNEAIELGDCVTTNAEEDARVLRKAGRSPVPDELYLIRLRELVGEAGGVVPSTREVARRLSIGQDRARRLIAMLEKKQDKGNSPAGLIR